MKEKKEQWIGFQGAERVKRVGGSLMIKLPRGYVEAHDIKEGDIVGIMANADLVIVANEKDKDKLYRQITKSVEEKKRKLLKELEKLEQKEREIEQKIKRR